MQSKLKSTNYLLDYPELRLIRSNFWMAMPFCGKQEVDRLALQAKQYFASWRRPQATVKSFIALSTIEWFDYTFLIIKNPGESSGGA
jgi:hypothetical protein